MPHHQWVRLLLLLQLLLLLLQLLLRPTDTVERNIPRPSLTRHTTTRLLHRLGLERGNSASSSVDVMVQLLEGHDQGGPCEEEGDWSYHNSFLVADAREAWVLETAGKWWAAERITAGELGLKGFSSDV